MGSRSGGLCSSSAHTFHADSSAGALRGGNAPPQLWELLFVSLHPIYFLQPRRFLLLSRLCVWLNRSFSSPRIKNAVGMKKSLYPLLSPALPWLLSRAPKRYLRGALLPCPPSVPHPRANNSCFFLASGRFLIEEFSLLVNQLELLDLRELHCNSPLCQELPSEPRCRQAFPPWHTQKIGEFLPAAWRFWPAIPGKPLKGL